MGAQAFCFISKAAILKAGLEGVLEFFLVIACVVAGKELVEGFIESQQASSDPGLIGASLAALRSPAIADHEDLFAGILS